MIGLGRCGIYRYTMEYYSAIKRTNNVICSNMDELETHILSEVSQEEKDKYHMISLTSGIYSMAQMKLFTEKKIMDSEHSLVVAKGEE